VSPSLATGKTGAAPKGAALNTATVRPAQVSTVQRFVPHYLGEPVAGFTHGIRNPDGTWHEPGGKAVPGATIAERPYYTDAYTTHHGAGPTGQESTQWNAAQVSLAHQLQKQNYGLPGYLLRSLLPGGLDEGGAKTPAQAVKAGVDIGSYLIPIGGPAVKAAGILGFGGKALRGIRGIKDVAEEAPAAANTTEAAAAVRAGLKGSKSQYGKEKAARKAEEAARVQKASAAFYAATNPQEALAGSGAALRGPYAKFDYKGLKELSPDTLEELQMAARDSPALGFYDSRKVMKALQAAVEEGINPRPHELRLIEIVFGKQNALAIAQQAAQNWFDRFLNIANIPRALQTTLDISGLGRQNLVAMLSHPVIGARTLPVTFKSMTAKGFEDAQQAVRNNPYYASFVAHGGQITEIGERAAMAAHEEGYQSDIAMDVLDKIPKVPNVIKGSARSYVALGNSMRMALYENRMRIAKLAADPTVNQEKTLRQITQVINAATGRGTIGPRAEHLLPAMNTFLFSPRLMLARLHYLDPSWYFRLSGPARREALRGLFALSGSVTTALYLFSRIPGVDVNWRDPQSANWGKVRIGNTRYDIGGGFQQYVRLASELAPGFLGGGYSVSSTTGKKTKLGSGYGVPTRFDVGVNFLTNKAAPAVGFAISGLRGHDPVGKPLTWGGLAENYLTPLTYQDAKQIYNEKHGGINGLEAALAGYGLSGVGIGVQTYPWTPASQVAPAGGSSGGNDPYFGGSGGGGGGDPYFNP